MGPEHPCGPSSVPGGGFAAAQILFFEKSGDSSLVCANDGGNGGASTGRVLDLEIATPQYAAMMDAATQGLAPGTYVVGNEHQNDPDLCMLPAGTTAFLVLFDAGGNSAVGISVSGTVTITSVSASAIAGSFSVTMGGPYGQIDAGTPTLSGSFDATACP
jgi:hypothetical protein